MALVTYPNFVDQAGLVEALAAAGIGVATEGATWAVSDLAKAQSIVASYNSLPYVQQQAITAARTHFASLVTTGYTYNGVLIAIGDSDRPNITGKAALALASITGGSGLTWTATMWQPQGSGAPLNISTAADMLTFANTIATYYSDLVTQAATLEGQIAAATTVAAAQAIDVTAGWPTPHN